MSRIVVIRNNTSETITINDLGQVISPNETFMLSECHSFHDLAASNSLKELIKDSIFTLNDGKKNLRVNEAIDYLTIGTVHDGKERVKNIILKANKSATFIFIGIMGIFISSLPIIEQLQSINKGENNLQTQIVEVESAIKNIRNLESFLKKTKDDMLATSEAKKRIEEEYNKAKELEKLSKIQIEAISVAVNKRSKTEILMNYFWGFVLGIASSLVASIIYGKTKKKIIA